jgi:uncharacterized protein YlxW (UPF0749 family)
LKKGKITVIVAMGLVALILTLTIFMQFKTVSLTDITAIETMRETELREELAGWKTKYEETETKLTEIEEKINTYKTEMQDASKAELLIKEEYDDTQDYLGYTDLEGQGIIITLKNTPEKSVVSENILTLVNELRLAGAEAISVNDERIVNTSEIIDVDTRFVIINGQRLVEPFVIKAIGDQKYLESSITIKGGYIDTMKANDIDVTYDTSDKVLIQKFDKKLSLNYAK